MQEFLTLRLHSRNMTAPGGDWPARLRSTLEAIGGRWNLKLVDFAMVKGSVTFRYDREDFAYDIMENVADELGIRPSTGKGETRRWEDYYAYSGPGGRR